MKLLKDGHLDGIIIDGTNYRIRYQHQRPRDDKGQLCNKGGTTVASILKDGVEIPRTAEFPPDRYYLKKLGRIIATGRLLKTLGIPRQ